MLAFFHVFGLIYFGGVRYYVISDSAPDETALTVAPPGVGRKKRGAKPLGSLRERMEEKLQAARFRYINEQLYTRSGSEAVTLFRDDPEAFDVYHRGFAFQVAKWPVNPVDRVIQYISEKYVLFITFTVFDLISEHALISGPSILFFLFLF